MIADILQYEPRGVYDDGWTDVEAVLPIKPELCGKIINLTVYVPSWPGEGAKTLTIETEGYTQEVALERGETLVCRVPIPLTPSPKITLRTTPEPAGADRRRLGVLIAHAESVKL